MTKTQSHGRTTCAPKGTNPHDNEAPRGAKTVAGAATGVILGGAVGGPVGAAFGGLAGLLIGATSDIIATAE
jgi:hypothetical protein